MSHCSVPGEVSHDLFSRNFPDQQSLPTWQSDGLPATPSSIGLYRPSKAGLVSGYSKPLEAYIHQTRLLTGTRATTLPPDAMGMRGAGRTAAQGDILQAGGEESCPSRQEEEQKTQVSGGQQGLSVTGTREWRGQRPSRSQRLHNRYGHNCVLVGDPWPYLEEELESVLLPQALYLEQKEPQQTEKGNRGPEDAPGLQ